MERGDFLAWFLDVEGGVDDGSVAVGCDRPAGVTFGGYVLSVGFGEGGGEDGAVT